MTSVWGKRWAQEEIDLLRRLWADGLSAGEIARRLPGRSRNMVIGRVGRMNLFRGGSRNWVPRLSGQQSRPSARNEGWAADFFEWDVE